MERLGDYAARIRRATRRARERLDALDALAHEAERRPHPPGVRVVAARELEEARDAVLRLGGALGPLLRDLAETLGVRTRDEGMAG